MITSSVYI